MTMDYGKDEINFISKLVNPENKTFEVKCH